ncbi:PIN domain-containing protein [Nostoc sp. DSM 114167]|jgi:predicted nucleic acid-binding protein|uniref:PIN domain-containing protein n=1 Tax=Nostoc sp. DSM 114167 TaxID=3439050 RepID=UPI004045E578
MIFIDANILLRFYNTNAPEFRKLLETLLKLKNKLFITEQVANEVRRNRLNVTLVSVNNYSEKLKINNVSIPVHLTAATAGTTAQDWNDERKKLEKAGTDLSEKFSSYVHSLLSSIEHSEDTVTQVLEKIFEDAIKASDSQTKRAETRKMLGHPPGKTKDAIGDELSWEQLLDSFDYSKSLWIITADSDYFSKFKGKLYLNSFLYRELRQKCGEKELKFHLYDSLSEALREYQKGEDLEIEDLPPEEELKQIEEEEKRIIVSPTMSNYPDLQIQKIGACPRCSVRDQMVGPAALISRYGGLTMQYICMNCGFHYDTGDYLD